MVALASASAATFTVTTTAPTGSGSLAQAIADANANPGFDTIAFNISGAGVQKVDLSQASLPTITDPVVIDGYTQPGAAPNTLLVGDNAVILIQLDGGAKPNGFSGLSIAAPNCVVRGLAITGFAAKPNQDPSSLGGSTGGYGVYVDAGQSLIEGNFIGLNPDGITANGNHIGIDLDSSAAMATIGGVDPAARNVISGQSGGYGIELSAPTPAVLGNYVGTDRSGSLAVLNTIGIAVGVSNVTIGGTEAGAGNLISGNYDGIDLGTEVGYHVSAHADNVLIQGNLIGTTANGTGDLGNLFRGVSLVSSNSVVGGLTAGAGNVIAFNYEGVFVTGDNNSVLTNSIYGSGSQGIVGGSASPGGTVQSPPIISSQTFAPGSVTVMGTVQSVAKTQVLIQFFGDSQSLTSSKQTYLGSTTVTTDANGNGSFKIQLAIADNNIVVNATATDADGNTSIFFGNPAYLLNLSARGYVGTGENALIGGMYVRYASIVVRALGPSLAAAGVSDALADPTLTFQNSSGTSLFDDNWQDNSNQASQVQQAGLAPSNPLEAALAPFSYGFPSFVGLAPHTAIVRGKGDGVGVGLVEIYGLTGGNYGNGPKLSNISARGFVASGDDVLIGGFIVGQGNEAARIVVRGIGPSLSSAGVANPLADPVLELYDSSGALITSNDNWADSQQSDLQTVGLAPTNSNESAILGRLPAGAYTAILRGKNNGTGVALVEVYDLP
jgi:hypothetical protein